MTHILTIRAVKGGHRYWCSCQKWSYRVWHLGGTTEDRMREFRSHHYEHAKENDGKNSPDSV